MPKCRTSCFNMVCRAGASVIEVGAPLSRERPPLVRMYACTSIGIEEGTSGGCSRQRRGRSRQRRAFQAGPGACPNATARRFICIEAHGNHHRCNPCNRWIIPRMLTSRPPIIHSSGPVSPLPPPRPIPNCYERQIEKSHR